MKSAMKIRSHKKKITPSACSFSVLLDRTVCRSSILGCGFQGVFYKALSPPITAAPLMPLQQLARHLWVCFFPCLCHPSKCPITVPLHPTGSSPLQIFVNCHSFFLFPSFSYPVLSLLSSSHSCIKHSTVLLIQTGCAPFPPCYMKGKQMDTQRWTFLMHHEIPSI